MDSLKSIEAELNSYKTSLDIEGESVDALIKFVAYSIYLNQCKQINDKADNVISETDDLNTVLEYACDKFFSTFRGRNQHIKISSARCLNDCSYSKFELVTRIGKYKLLSAQNYTFTKNNTYAIEFIICKDLIEEDMTLFDNYSAMTKSGDYTSELVIRDLSGLYPFTESLPSPNKIFLGTINDYNVKLIDTEGNSDFSHNNFSVKSPKYLAENMDITKVKVIPNFYIKNSIITSEDFQERVSSTSVIYSSTTINESEVKVVKSISEISNMLSRKFLHLKNCNIKLRTNSAGTKVLRVYYIGTLTGNESSYVAELKTTYEIDFPFEFVQATVQNTYNTTMYIRMNDGYDSSAIEIDDSIEVVGDIESTVNLSELGSNLIRKYPDEIKSIRFDSYTYPAPSSSVTRSTKLPAFNSNTFYELLNATTMHIYMSDTAAADKKYVYLSGDTLLDQDLDQEYSVFNKVYDEYATTESHPTKIIIGDSSNNNEVVYTYVNSISNTYRKLRSQPIYWGSSTYFTKTSPEAFVKVVYSDSTEAVVVVSEGKYNIVNVAVIYE